MAEAHHQKRLLRQTVSALVLLVSFASALEWSADFTADLGDTSAVAVGTSGIQLGVEEVFYVQAMDTLLDYGRNWLTGTVGNDRGAMPVVRAVAPGDFRAAYMGYAAAANQPWRNVIGLVRVLPASKSMSFLDSIEERQHNPYPYFYNGSTNEHPLPAYLQLRVSGNRWVSQWSADRTTGLGPITFSGSMLTTPDVPITYGRFLHRPISLPLPATPSDTDYILGTGSQTMSNDIAAIAGMNQAVHVHSPVRGGGAYVHIRWQTLEPTTILAIDSIAPTTPGRYYAGVAAQDDGLTLLSWTEGTTGTDLWVQAFAPDHSRRGVPTLVQSGIMPRTDGVHRDYGIASLGNGRFALVYGRSNVIFLRVVDASSDPVTVGAEESVSPAGNAARYPSVESNDHYMVVAWWRDEGSAKRPEFARWTRAGNGWSDTLFRRGPKTVSFPSTSYPLTHNWTIVSATVDDSGNVLTGYNDSLHARITAFRNEPVFLDSGFYASKALDLRAPGVLLPLAAEDSVRFLAATLYASGKGTASMLLEQGADAGFSAVSALVVDSATHKTPVRSAASFFRYYLDLKRDSAGTGTPQVDSIRLNWTLRPRAPLPATVRVGTGSAQAWSKGLLSVAASRRDTVRITVSADDLDFPAQLTLRSYLGSASFAPAGIPLTATLIPRTGTPGRYDGTLVIPPLDTIVDTLRIILRSDDGSWIGNADTVLFRYYNIAPQDSLRLLYRRGNGSQVDTAVTSGAGVRIQVGDSVKVAVVFQDSNDVADSLVWTVRSGSTAVTQGASRVTMPGRDTIGFVMPTSGGTNPDSLLLSIRDADTSLTRVLRFIPNHRPELDSLAALLVRSSGDSLLWRGNPEDTAGIGVPIGPSIRFVPFGRDQDSVNGDKLTRQWHLLRIGSAGCCTDSLIHTGDTLITTFAAVAGQKIRLHQQDLTGASSEDTLGLLFSKLDTAGSTPFWRSARNDFAYLTVSPAATLHDTVQTVFRSTGTVSLALLSGHTGKNLAKVLDIRLLHSNGSGIIVTERTDSAWLSPAAPFTIAPGDSVVLTLVVDGTTVHADSTLLDTLVFTTDDWALATLSLPLRFRWAQPPTVRLHRDPNASTDRNYSRDTLDQYFPPFSSLVVAFSEPVLARRLTQQATVYSLSDSIARGQPGIDAMDPYYPGGWDLRRHRRPNGTMDTNLVDSMVFAPRYRSASDHFGILPPPRNFIRGDIVRIRLTNQITDSLGNRLDLYGNGSSATTRTWAAYVDTAVLRVVETDPPQGGVLDPDKSIRIVFNQPLALWNLSGGDSVRSLDLTHLGGDSNATVHLSSRWSAWQDLPLRPLVLTQGDSVLLVRPRLNFHSGDTGILQLSAVLSDRYGRSLDGNNDHMTTWPPDSADSFSLQFVTGQASFYTFPNPWMGVNGAHRNKGSITFTNLHQIHGIEAGRNITIRILTPDGTLVRDTRVRGPQPMVLEGDPEHPPTWEWDLRNDRGEAVASGTYLYLIGHGQTVYKKGKLAIVR